MLPQRLPKAVHVGTTVIYFTIINLVKVVPYLALGLFDARNLTNEKYAATTNIAASFQGNAGAAYYPGMPRSAYVGIEGKW